jgi:hypothetical protein
MARFRCRVCGEEARLPTTPATNAAGPLDRNPVRHQQRGLPGEDPAYRNDEHQSSKIETTTDVLLWIVSDLHLELTRGWDLPSGGARPRFDVLVVGGNLNPRMEHGVDPGFDLNFVIDI